MMGKGLHSSLQLKLYLTMGQQQDVEINFHQNWGS